MLSAHPTNILSTVRGLWLNSTTRARPDPRGLFRETRAADPGLRQSPRTLSGRACVVEFSLYRARHRPARLYRTARCVPVPTRLQFYILHHF